MKKLTTIFGAILFASFTLTSCGGVESDAKKAADLTCELKNADKKDKDQMKKLREDLKAFQEETEKAYESKEDKKAFAEAYATALKNCK